MYSKLTKRNHYEEITEQMKRLIQDGKLQAGDKLPSTRELSERFGVGRSTMREALSALKAMGLIDIKQGGGCRVISSLAPEAELPELLSLKQNRDTLLELLEARQALEASNAAIAAEKATAADLAALRSIVHDMEEAAGDDVAGERNDLLFHHTLAQATHNSIMIQLFESIMNRTEAAIHDIRRVEIYANRLVAERLYHEHAAICEAVSTRDGDAAALWMKVHLQHVGEILTKYFREG